MRLIANAYAGGRITATDQRVGPKLKGRIGILNSLNMCVGVRTGCDFPQIP